MASKYVDKVGVENMILLNMSVMGFTFMCFGLIDVIDNRVNIMALAIFLRLIQGMACGSNYITCLTIAANEYPKKKEKVCGIFSVGYGFGLMIGPLIGSTLFSFLGFKHMFFVFGGSEVLLGVFIRLNISKKAN